MIENIHERYRDELTGWCEAQELTRSASRRFSTSGRCAGRMPEEGRQGRWWRSCMAVIMASLFIGARG